MLCKIFGHRYHVYAKPIEDWAIGIRWLKCKRCKRNFLVNDRVRCLLSMDFEMKDLHQWKVVQDG